MHPIPERLKMKDGGPPLPSSKEIFIYESKYNKEEEEQAKCLLFLFLILHILSQYFHIFKKLPVREVGVQLVVPGAACADVSNAALTTRSMPVE